MGRAWYVQAKGERSVGMEERAPVENRERQKPGGVAASSARWERWLRTLVVAVSSIGFGYLFFSNLWWMLPPDFGCSEDFQFEGENASGLCFWIGTFSSEPRTVLTTFLEPAPLGVALDGLPQANGAFIDGFMQPNIEWFGWVIWGTVAFVSLSLVLGFLTRLGALAAFVVSVELVLGLTGISSPRGWEWAFPLMVLLSIALFGLAPGRYFGLDRLLRPRLMALRDRGSRAGRLLLAFT